MDYFFGLVRACDALAFRALPDGRIPAGIAGEIEEARCHCMPVIELPSSESTRKMTVEHTREYLHQVGQR